MGFFSFLSRTFSISGKAQSEYIVLDIETTGFSRIEDRIIEIAANKYRNGELVDQFHTYVNPEVEIPVFITQLTGIRNKDVLSAPTIKQIRKKIVSFLGSSTLVGHNIIRFDIPFLQHQLGLTFRNKVYDTLEMAKTAFPGLPSYRLSYLDQALLLGGEKHHRAENDILVTNALFLACQSPKKYSNLLKDKARLAEIPIKKRPSMYSTIDIHAIHPSNPDMQPNTMLSGKNIVFSGCFSIPLEEIMQQAVDAGATLKTCVSKKVHYLVVGDQDARFTDENGMTSKSRTAHKLIDEGIPIQIIDEETFKALSKSIPHT